MNKPFNARRELLKREVARLIPKLEGAVEIDYVIGALTEARRKLSRTLVTAMETQTREFLNRRWLIFGSQFEGPWPLQFVEPLEVTFKQSGMDFEKNEPYAARWKVNVTAARFVRLGLREMGRYVELQVPAAIVIPSRGERESYAIKADERLPVYCTIYRLIQAKPKWDLDGPTKAKIARLRAIAANAVNNATGAQQ